MELGKLAVWCSLEGGSLAQAVEAAQRIEALGYSALWQPMALRRDVMVTASLQLAAWCGDVSRRYGYRVEERGVGEPDPEMGPPTQMAVFDRREVP